MLQGVLTEHPPTRVHRDRETSHDAKLLEDVRKTNSDTETKGQIHEPADTEGSTT